MEKVTCWVIDVNERICIKEIFDDFSKVAIQIVESGKEHINIMFGKKNNNIQPLVLNFKNNDEERKKAILIVRKMFHNAEWVIHISEGWLIKRKLKGRIERPSKAKDRKECLNIMLHTSDGFNISRTYLIKERKKGGLIKEDETEGHNIVSIWSPYLKKQLSINRDKTI
ncbi:MAG: hypothetical protein ACE5J9_04375 [Methanosarcinales archaeon]